MRMNSPRRNWCKILAANLVERGAMTLYACCTLHELCGKTFSWQSLLIAPLLVLTVLTAFARFSNRRRELELECVDPVSESDLYRKNSPLCFGSSQTPANHPSGNHEQAENDSGKSVVVLIHGIGHGPPPTWAIDFFLQQGEIESLSKRIEEFVNKIPKLSAEDREDLIQEALLAALNSKSKTRSFQVRLLVANKLRSIRYQRKKHKIYLEYLKSHHGRDEERHEDGVSELIDCQDAIEWLSEMERDNPRLAGNFLAYISRTSRKWRDDPSQLVRLVRYRHPTIAKEADACHSVETNTLSHRLAKDRGNSYSWYRAFAFAVAAVMSTWGD